MRFRARSDCLPYKRKAEAMNPTGFRTKIRRRKMYGPKARPRWKAPLYNNPSVRFHQVVLKDLRSHTFTSGADLFAVLQPADVLSCPAFSEI